MFTVRTLKKFSRGFTLIELMVVVAVIAILATIALFGLSGVQKGARDTQRLATANGIRTALERYNANQGSYPPGPFSAMATYLTGGSYLVNVFDPGCGGGSVAINNLTTGNGSWAPCTTGPYYSYAVSGGTYTLWVVKEAAGTATLQGPQ